MKSTEQQALDCLQKLVEHVFAHRDSLVPTITYEALAAAIGRLDKHGAPHARGMGSQVLFTMGKLLQHVEGKWGEGVPNIQGIVVQKTGKYHGLPDEGIKAFWPDYPKMSRCERENKVQCERLRITEFGSRWNDVLEAVALPPVVQDSDTGRAASSFGRGGESPEHKALKEYVRCHPAIVKASLDWKSFVEYPLPSFDTIDVFFRGRTACVAVEVKSVVSDRCKDDYHRGIYQTIKYRAVLEAMAKAGNKDVPASIRSVLVLQSSLPEEYRTLVATLQIEVIEKIVPVGSG
jgi:hypothetical protein